MTWRRKILPQQTPAPFLHPQRAANELKSKPLKKHKNTTPLSKHLPKELKESSAPRALPHCPEFPKTLWCSLHHTRRAFMRIFALFTLFLVTVTAPARAAGEIADLLNLPADHSILHLSATEQVEAEQDLLVATLRIRLENADAGALQNAVNETMKKALALAEKVESVKASTRQYYVHQYSPDRHSRDIKIWRGEQGLQLKGKNADALLALTGALQEIGLTMEGLSYALSPEKQESIMDSLLETALKKLQTKADSAAKALGKSGAELLDVQIQNSGPFYPAPARGLRMEMAMADDAGMSAPSAAPGESMVSLTVAAKALLKP